MSSRHRLSGAAYKKLRKEKDEKQQDFLKKVKPISEFFGKSKEG